MGYGTGGVSGSETATITVFRCLLTLRDHKRKSFGILHFTVVYKQNCELRTCLFSESLGTSLPLKSKQGKLVSHLFHLDARAVGANNSGADALRLPSVRDSDLWGGGVGIGKV
eukprot:Hpha_TRINITY_DN14801_c0_g1::TRINITY_DN14801_c0_g1_i1::g.169177::m.169177